MNQDTQVIDIKYLVSRGINYATTPLHLTNNKRKEVKFRLEISVKNQWGYVIIDNIESPSSSYIFLSYRKDTLSLEVSLRYLPAHNLSLNAPQKQVEAHK